MEVPLDLRAALTQTRNINLLKFIAIKKKKTKKPEKFRYKKLDLSIQKISHATSNYDLLEKRSSRIGSVGGSWTPWNLSVSWAACPVFELKLEGNEAWCAKHFPRVTPQGKGHGSPRVCGGGTHISQLLLPTQFPRTCFIYWGSL